MITITIHEEVNTDQDAANLLEYVAGLIRNGSRRGYGPSWELSGAEEPEEEDEA